MTNNLQPFSSKICGFFFLQKENQQQNDWLRTTGSIIISQLFDSFIVLGIAFWVPSKINTETFVSSALIGYTFKLMTAVALTPLIYSGHLLIKKYLSEE